jgi:hypothetical protein
LAALDASRSNGRVNVFQFGFDDLARMLPKRGVAMVYLAQEDD